MRRISISTMLLLSFLAISTCIIGLGGYLLYLQSGEILASEVYNHLTTATSSRAEQIKTYLGDSKMEVKIMSSSIAIINFLEASESDPDYGMKKAIAEKRLMQVKESEPDYQEVFVIGTDGKTVLSSDYTSIGEDKSGDTLFTEGRRGLFLKDPYISERTGMPQFGIAVPMYGANGSTVGIYAARLNMDELVRIAEQRQGLGNSGELFVMNRQGYLLTPMRQLDNEPLGFRIDTEISRGCVAGIEAHSLQGGQRPAPEGKAMVSTDCRGVEVVGAYDYALPQAEWCVIAKIDEREALGEPRQKLLYAFAGTGLALIIASCAALYLLSREVSNSAKRISDKVDRITRGELGIELGESRITEMQSLINSLNRILASLKLAILRTGLNKSDIGIGEALAMKNEAENRYRAIYEQSSDAIMTIEPPEWNFTSGNPAALKLFGLQSEKDFAKVKPWELSPEKQPDGKPSREQAKKMIELAMKEGRAFFSWTHKEYNGQQFPATVLLTKTKIGGKEVLQATVRKRDFEGAQKGATGGAAGKAVKKG